MKTKGFTFPELMLAIALTAVIGLAAAGVAVALGYAQSQTDAMTDAIQSARTGMMGADAALRKAALVTAATGDSLSLWAGDANTNGRIDTDELVVLAYLPDTRTLERWQVVFPANMDPAVKAALNEERPLADVTGVPAVTNILNRAVYASYLSRIVLATDVADFHAAVDVSPPLARRVTLRLTTGGGNQRITLTDSATLRCDATARVDTAGASPVLRAP